MCRFFCFYWYSSHRDLHSFPTRRSSDLFQRVRVTFTSTGSPVTLAIAAEEGEAQVRVDDVRVVPFTAPEDRKSTRLNSSHVAISYAVFCLKKKNNQNHVDKQENQLHLKH